MRKKGPDIRPLYFPLAGMFRWPSGTNINDEGHCPRFSPYPPAIYGINTTSLSDLILVNHASR